MTLASVNQHRHDRLAAITPLTLIVALSHPDRRATAGVRPDRANPTICSLNSGVYRTVLSAIVNSSFSNGEVSTKPGQLHWKDSVRL